VTRREYVARIRAHRGRRAILVRDGAGRVRARVPTSTCSWCTDEFVCSACHARAERARAGIARSDARATRIIGVRR